MGERKKYLPKVSPRLSKRKTYLKPLLKSLTIENYKAFSNKNKNTLILKPITLIYGWNNSGKSSILELVQLISNIFKSPNQFDNSIESFDANSLLGIGSYENFIFENNISNDLKVSFEFKNILPSITFFPGRYNQISGWKEFQNKVTQNKFNLDLTYSSSISEDEISASNSLDTSDSISILEKIDLNMEGIFKVNTEKFKLNDLTFFKIKYLDFDSLNSEQFFKVLSVNRQVISTELSNIYKNINNVDINLNEKNAIGGEIQKILKKIIKGINQNLFLAKHVEGKEYLGFMGDKYYSSSAYDVVVTINERNNQGPKKFLRHFYGKDQISDLNASYKIFTEIIEKKDDLSPFQTYFLINDALELLDFSNLGDEKFMNLLKKNIDIKEDYRLGGKTLSESFWEEIVNYFPKDLRKDFVTSGLRYKKIDKLIHTNRIFVSLIFQIDLKYLSIKEKLNSYLKEFQKESNSIKTLYRGKESFFTSADNLNTTDIHIRSDDYELLMSLIQSWDGKSKTIFEKIKKFFISDIKKTTFFNLKKSQYLSTMSEKSINLTNFIFGILINDENFKYDMFSYTLENFQGIVYSSLRSLNGLTLTNSFKSPSGEIKRFYGKNNRIGNDKDLDFFKDVNYEYFFNTLRNDENLLERVNESLVNMGFDFHIHFDLLQNKRGEAIFFPVAINNHNPKIHTNIADMGLGLKKIIPMITYLLSKREEKIVCIQEPEANLHPKYQAELSEIFSASYRTNKNYHLIETHSEILVLRLLKLIKNKVIKPDDLSVNFIEKINGEARIINIGVNEDGEFTNNWPKGFFKERLNELL